LYYYFALLERRMFSVYGFISVGYINCLHSAVKFMYLVLSIVLIAQMLT
jgi:hypothetical protein